MRSYDGGRFSVKWQKVVWASREVGPTAFSVHLQFNPITYSMWTDGRTPLPHYMATSCTWYRERYNYHRQQKPLKCMALQVWPQHYFKTSAYAFRIKVTVGYRKLNTGGDIKYGLFLGLFLPCSGSTFLQNVGRLTATRYRNPKDYHMINSLRTVQSCYKRLNTGVLISP